MKRTMIGLAVVLSAVAFMTTSCGQLFNDGAIEYLDEDVYVYEETEPAASAVPAESRVEARGRGNRRRIDEYEFQIKRVAQAPPVDVNGTAVQANDVLIVDEEAYVVYNTAGDVFAGALQVINFSRPARPVITTEIGLPNADVNAVAVNGDYIYLAGAWDPNDIAGYDAADPDRAFVVRIALRQLGRVSADDISAGKVILDSFAATGIAIKGSSVFVSTGALDGELEILDLDLNPTSSVAYGDLRDIEAYHGGVIALQGTDNSGLTNGRVLAVGDTGAEKTELVITDFGSAEKKATIEVYNNKYAFLGLSEAGFQIVYLRDDADVVESVFSVANPTGFDWTVKTDTNSASYSGSVLVTANGEAGFRIFRITDTLDGDEPVAGFAELVGFVPFDETDPDGDGVFWSANHVEFQVMSSGRRAGTGFLAVASGVGGVNFYTMQNTN